MVLRLNLKGRLKQQFRSISSLIQSGVTLDSLQQNIKWGWDSSCSMRLGYRILGVLPILCIAGFQRREKWISLYQMEYILCIYIFNHENNVPSWLSPKWLCDNSCNWGHDVHVHHVHHVPKYMSCNKAIVVITERAHCFHDCTYILRLSCFCEI